MSVPVSRPCYIAGTQNSSGDVGTAELRFTQGGGRAFTQWSGSVADNDVLIFSGAGRLNTLLQITQLVSGQAVVFYDSAIATSGGPFAASGHKIVGIIPSTFPGGAWSGNLIVPWTGAPVIVGMPFQSGLCAATRSGTPGFTAGYSVEN